jgi:hypothetical protein
MQSTYVKKYCEERNFTSNGRCCIQKVKNETKITGIDYSSCIIQKLTLTMDSLDLSALEYVQILDIQNNPLTECDKDAYAGLKSLNTLYHPTICNCPGLNSSWVNVTDLYCLSRKNLCNTNFANSNCTDNSECIENGPGNILCMCKPGFNGYKCLDEGVFPTIEFTLISCILTVVLSALLWFSQRRHVIKEE